MDLMKYSRVENQDYSHRRCVQDPEIRLVSQPPVSAKEIVALN
jgi:hypothetical protein